MNDVLLYTYPQKDGKYRLKNTLAVSGMKVMPYLYYKMESKLYSELLVLCWFMSHFQFMARGEKEWTCYQGIPFIASSRR